jgi:hypothetical protein
MPDTIDRLQGARTTFGMKKPVAAATTGAITLSGEQTIDGVACVEDDRVLVKDQADSAFNGIYDASTGAWTRSVDFDGNTDWVKGTLVSVAAGTINAGKIFRVTSADPVTIDEDDIDFESISFADPHANTSIVASATLNLNAVDADEISVTGTGASIATITLTEGLTRILRFTEAGNILVHSATLALPGAQSFTTIANDLLIVRGFSGGVVRVVNYERGDGHPLITGETSVVAAATVDLGLIREQALSITGSTGVSSFGTSAPAGTIKFIRVADGFLLTHGGNISLPSAQNVQTEANDTFIARAGAAGTWRVLNYTRVGEYSVNTTDTATAAITESDLMSMSLSANRMAYNGAALSVKAWGVTSTVSTAATKRMRMYFGATAIADSGAGQYHGANWYMEATVVRESASLASAIGTAIISTAGASTAGTAVTVIPTFPAENLAAAVTVKVTGLCTASTGLITAQGFMVKALSL